jgi:large subunit ribosomal protein L17
VERIITIAKRGVAPGTSTSGTPATIRALNARRLVMQDLQDRQVVTKLFDTIAPRFAERAGGYTRLLRLGFRKGDAADIAQVELVGSEFNPRAKAQAEAGAADNAPKAKGMGSRLRAAAERLRGKKEQPGSEDTATTAKRGSRRSDE